jgi:hypothetical protein
MTLPMGFCPMQVFVEADMASMARRFRRWNSSASKTPQSLPWCSLRELEYGRG